ncbi:hypothetical protein MKX54_02085 [Alkalihalobacillus sp. FSL R5-0424]
MDRRKNRYYLKMFFHTFLLYGVFKLVWVWWGGDVLDIQELLMEIFIFSFVYAGGQWFFEWAKPPPRKEDP